MKKHDNTLYVTTQGAYLARKGTNVLVRIERKTRMCLPVHTIGSIVCFGNVACSPFVMGMCGEAGVGITFLSRNGRFLARVEGPQSGNVILRRAQHAVTSDPEFAAITAKNIVSAKVANSRTVLQRAVRDHGLKMDVAGVQRAITRLAALLTDLTGEIAVDRIRGLEGDAARTYFGVFDELILARKDQFFFHQRTRRPPKDNSNSLLSFVYALLTHDMTSACQSVGLDPQMGFLHADRPGRPSLALDLVEEFRAFLADRLVLSLINRQQVDAKGFNHRETGSVEMNDQTRKTILVAYQKRKEEEIVHPFLNEKMTIGLLPHIQARLLARWLRGDLDGYPAFFWK
ncbi:MAG: type I-C CRISPR-associated endonuclease Cas1 [Pirellulales bacterium]|nr:type I-C CRISPR-associated endonuclease Cas1 [Pirellulales bacterium]